MEISSTAQSFKPRSNGIDLTPPAEVTSSKLRLSIPAKRKSKKSGSSSKPRSKGAVRKKIGRSKLLQRPVGFDKFNEEHLESPYFWAAYRMGGLQPLPRGMEVREFEDAVIEIAGTVIEAGGDYITVFSGEDPKPIGFVLMSLHQGRLWPHVEWFKFTSARDRLTAAVMFFQELGKEYNMCITAPEEHVRFYDRVCKYGVLRPVGTLKAGPEPLRLYETV